MNETVLALVGALAIYGLTSLALPVRTGDDRADDLADVQPGDGKPDLPASTSDDPPLKG